jgi:phosphopantothenoylcysteine decarboxylase/phosphopantothenate--cysteine ligase
MNNNMYAHPATQANLATLRDRGVTVIEPDEGPLASRGEWGVGRLPEPALLLSAVEGAVARTSSLVGVQVLVTAGGTREPIDGVRYVGNRSSGRMGIALAAEAARRGAHVTVVAANVALPRVPGVEYVDVETAAELAAACHERFGSCDVLLMSAAVADFRPGAPVAGKLKKAGREGLELSLEPTEDVLARLAAARRDGQTLVGFAAEHGEGAREHAREKRARKGLDLVVVNDISRADIGFDSEHNEVTIVGSDRETAVPRAAKSAVAAAVLDEVERLRAAPEGRHGAAGGTGQGRAAGV